jgi:hypothetical protein
MDWFQQECKHLMEGGFCMGNINHGLVRMRMDKTRELTGTNGEREVRELHEFLLNDEDEIGVFNHGCTWRG